MMKKVAVILSGCGFLDGAEIQETTLSLYALAKHQIFYDVFAPDIEQHHVINHISGEEMNESRNVLVESARIVRGAVKPLHVLNINDYDGLFIPGGFGVAKNISDLAFKGADFNINNEFSEVIKTAYDNKKPIGALCIAPAVISKLLPGITVTIGTDVGTSQMISSVGAIHIDVSDTDGIVIDEKNLLVTSPCYMLENDILGVAQGAENVVVALKKLL